MQAKIIFKCSHIGTDHMGQESHSNRLHSGASQNTVLARLPKEPPIWLLAAWERQDNNI